MFRALSWTLVTFLLVLWSVVIWALHAVAAWTLGQAGGAGELATLQLPAWLAAWLPSEWTGAAAAMLAGLTPLVEGLLQVTPVLAGGLTVLSWLVWGLGVLLLLGFGAIAHLLPALWRHREALPNGLTRLVAQR